MNALQLVGQQSVTLIPDALGHRDKLIAEAEHIASVEDEMDQADAAEVYMALREVAKMAEQGRVAVKSPVLELERQIDGLAKEFLAPLKPHIDRIGALLAAFTKRQRDAAEAAERARQAALAEERRKAAEAESARKAAEEAARKAAEEAQKKAEAEFMAEPVDVAKAKAAAEAAQAKAADEAARAEAARKAAEEAEAARLKAMVSTRKIVAPTLPGIRVGDTWEYEVLDVKALFDARPDLVELVPKAGEIRKAIKGGTQIPGLRVWQETKMR